jgi:predicted transposase/invertase (TIGR01784 family)
MSTQFETSGETINICWDEVFKAVFASEKAESRAAIQGLLSAYLERPLLVIKVTIVELPLDSPNQRQIRYDLVVEFEDRSMANVEMTISPGAGENLRMEYYLSRLYSSQDIRSPMSFKDLKPTYHLSFVVEAPLFKDDEWIHRFIYYDPERKIELGGRTAIFTVELSKLGQVPARPVQEMTQKERWACYFRYYQDMDKQPLLKEILAEEEDIAMAEQVARGFSPEQLAYFQKTLENANSMQYYSELEEKKEREQELQAKTQQLEAAEERNRQLEEEIRRLRDK